MDPEIAAALCAGDKPTPSLQRLSGGTPDATRAFLEVIRSVRPRIPYDPVPPLGLRRDELTVPGIGDAARVAVRIHRVARPSGVPVAGLVWFHGGGYIRGTYDADARFLEDLVERNKCVAVSVEYRLAPETPYPGPLNDCFAGIRFLFENAEELGVDPTRLVVGGCSAGAGLAAACALRARTEDIPLMHQHLIYPMLDDTQTTPSSTWDRLAVWPREMTAFAWQCYLGDLYGTGRVPAFAAPARAADLSGLPSTYIHVGSLDGFLHEDLQYASRLTAAGVPTELHVFPMVPHAFEQVAPDARVSKAANGLSGAALARVLA